MNNDIATLQNSPASKPPIRAKAPPFDAGAVCFAMVQNEADAVYFRDMDGICRMANGRCAELFGVPVEKMVGGPLAPFFPPEAACAIFKQEAAVLEDGVERGMELTFQEPGGAHAYWMSHALHRNVRGEIVGVAGRFCDIAERKRLEREVVEISERVMHRVARDLHDEFCQELAAVSLIARLLQKRLGDTDDADAQAKVAAHIADITRQMAASVRDLVHNLAPMNLNGEMFVASLRRVASQICSAFPVKCGIEGSWPEQVQAPEVAIQFYRIAHEAMYNAARHGGGSCITVRLRVSPSSLMLSVADDGKGFDPAMSCSSGMGLSSMRYRAGLVGGELSIDSVPGVGTRVTCRAPLGF